MTKVRFTIIKRGHSLDRLIAKLNVLVTGSVTFECNMCDKDGDIKLVSVDNMLLETYNMFKETNGVMLKDLIAKCQQVIDELNMVAKIKKVLPDRIKQYPDDFDSLVTTLNQDTNIEINVIKELFDKYTVPRIIKCKTDTDQKENEKNDYINKLNNIDTYVWSKY